MAGIVADAGFAEALEHIDDPDAVARLAAELPRAPGVRLFGCPSTWGRPRRARVDAALRAIGTVAELVPRAELIAASHADAASDSCAVVETAAVPSLDGTWTVQRVVRGPTGWRIDRSALLDPPGTGSDDEAVAILSAADLIVVDGPDAAELPAAGERVQGLAPRRRVCVADRSLMLRHGARGRFEAPVPSGPAWEPRAGGTRSWRWLGVVIVVLAVIGAGVAVRMRVAAPAAGQVAVHQVGPGSVEVPAQWRRTELTGDDTTDGTGVRAVFADADDGRRLIVVVTRLRTGSTSSSVATSMRNRIGQRGDGVVVEFAPESTYAGRQVISYRERPASGPEVRWYIVVEHDVQISLGCQPGTGATSIDPPCRDAVASARVEDG